MNSITVLLGIIVIFVNYELKSINERLDKLEKKEKTGEEKP